MKNRMTIDSFPLQGGLVNAGAQAGIPESSFWEMEGAATGMDGRAYKRAGLQQWGQQLVSPDPGGVGLIESFRDLSQLEQDNAPEITFQHNDTIRYISTSLTPSASALLARTEQPNDGTWDDSGQVDAIVAFKANGALPAQSATTNQDYGPSFALATDSGDYTFLFLSGAIYYYNGASFVPSLANVDDSRWHRVQFSITSATTAKIYVDEVLADTITLAQFSGYGLNNRRFYVAAATIETGLFDFEVDSVVFRSGNGNISGEPVTALFDWSSHNPDKKHLLAVAGNVIYDDRGHGGRWSVLDATAAGDLTTFAPWQDELLIINPRQPVRRWAGTGAPVGEPAILPQNVYVAASHQSRVCVVSEDAPLIVYVSAASDITDWTTPTVVSPSGESFFLRIPDARGKRVVGMRGDFYGQLVIWTEESAFTLQGSGIDTYVLQRVSEATGALGPRAFDQAAKDLIFASSRGVHSLATTIQYGDMAASDISKDIRNLWQHDNQFGLRKMISNYRSSVVHAPELARTYLAVQQRGDIRPASIFEFNHDTGRWSGPWPVECEAIAFVLLSVPGVPTLLVGGTDGRVSRVSSDRRSDPGDTSYDFRLRSARLDGRSLDPSLRRRDKHWHELRLFVLPRGAEGLELTWTADGHKRSESIVVSQNKYNEGLVDTTFFLDQSYIVDAEKVAVVTQILDKRSKWLEFEVGSTSLDGDAVILGFQVDFTAAQDSRENA